MILPLVITTMGFIVVLLGIGHFFIGDGRGASGFKIAGYLMMLTLGLLIGTTGIAIDTGEVNITSQAGTTYVTPTYEQLPGATSFVGVPLLALGILGLFLTIIYQRDSRNPYAEGGLKPPA